MTFLVAHSYGGSIITEAGVHPNVVGLVYVAAHAPAVGEDESDLGKGMPSYTSKQPGAIKKTDDGYTYLNPADFPEDFAADLPLKQAQFEAQSQILTAAKVFSAPMTVAAWTTKPTRSSTRTSNAGTTRVHIATRPSSLARATPFMNHALRKSLP
jgi:pimeloyl-ACP methyl ester carboxylesterase